MHGKLIVLAALAAGIALLPHSARSATGGTSAAQGYYSAAQAEAGAALYATHCAMCHGKDLEGTYEIPPLKGRFLGNWGHAPLGRLFDYVSRAMPQFSPGSLSPADNAAIIAHILKQNDMPAGTKPLVGDAKVLDAISIEPTKH